MEGLTQIGIGWEVGVPSGWGTYGLKLSLDLVRRGITPALFFVDPKLAAEPPPALKYAVAQGQAWHQRFRAGPVRADFPMLHALGDQLEFFPAVRGLRGMANIAIAFCESAIVP